MRVLGFGTYDVTLHPRFGVLLQGLSDLGIEVTEANERLGLSTSDKVGILTSPRRIFSLAAILAGKWRRIARSARAASKSHQFDAILVGYMGHFDVLLARALFPRGRLVLDQMVFAADTALDRGSRGVKVHLLGLLDRLAVRCASIVILDTAEQQDLMSRSQRYKAVVVPVGSPSMWFEAGAQTDRAPRPETLRVVFYGLFTPLQGAITIAEALAALSDYSKIRVTMIGGGQDFDQTRQIASVNPYIDWIDWVESDALPAIIAQHDVCLGIFGTTAKGRRVVPNKVFQGAAAGCAVVTSDTPPQRRIMGDAARYVPPGDSRALARVLVDLADHPEVVADLKLRSSMLAELSFVPRVVVMPLLERLNA